MAASSSSRTSERRLVRIFGNKCIQYCIFRIIFCPLTRPSMRLFTMLVLEWNHQFHRMRRGSGQEASEGWPIVIFIMCARGHSEPVVIWIKKQDSSKMLHATTGFIIEENVAMRVDSLAKFVTCQLAWPQPQLAAQPRPSLNCQLGPRLLLYSFCVCVCVCLA